MKKIFSLHFRRKANGMIPDAPQNEYYENASAHFGILQVVCYLSLFAFVILSFFWNTELITYRNFYYFFKDLDASAETVDVFSTDSITYPTAEQQSFTLYRKGLAVAGNHNVTIFTATGRQTVTKIINYQNPTAVGSGKYLLVYELGGYQYSLYNAYTQIYYGKSDFPILGAAVSDSGMYALISSSEKYSSVVSLYNSNFSLLNRYNKNGYVMDIDIQDSGALVAILTSSSSGGLWSTVLELYEPGKSDLRASVELGTSAGLSCHFTSSGRISVLCGDRISFVSHAGKIDSFWSFDGSSIRYADLNEDGVAIALNGASALQSNSIIIFDKNGKMLYNETVPETVEQLSMTGNTLYILTSNGISRLNSENGEFSKTVCDTARCSILALDANEILLCSPQKAQYIRFAS